MTTKRAALRKGKSASTTRVTKTHNSRAARKTATAARIAFAAVGETAAKKAAQATLSISKAKASAVAKAPAGKAKK